MTDEDQLTLFDRQAEDQIRLLREEIEQIESEIRPKIKRIDENKKKIVSLEEYLSLSKPPEPSAKLRRPVRHIRIRPKPTTFFDSVGDVAVRVLERHGSPLHYKTLMEKMETEEAFQVPGTDPNANFLAHLSNDDRIIRTDRGVYGLREWQHMIRRANIEALEGSGQNDQEPS